MKKITAILLFACIVGQAYAWKPKFAGHRGSYRGVENTEEAMMNGINHYGYTGLEIDVKTTPEYAELQNQVNMLRTINGDDFAGVKPKFREQVYGMMDHGPEAKPAAEQLPGIREQLFF